MSSSAGCVPKPTRRSRDSCRCALSCSVKKRSHTRSDIGLDLQRNVLRLATVAFSALTVNETCAYKMRLECTPGWTGGSFRRSDQPHCASLHCCRAEVMGPFDPGATTTWRRRSGDLILLEHRLHLVRIAGAGEGQHEQDAGLPGLQVVGRDDTAPAQSRAARHSPRSHPAGLADQHAALAGAVDRLVLERRRAARAGTGADNAFRAGRYRGVDERAIGAGVRDHNVYAG